MPERDQHSAPGRGTAPTTPDKAEGSLDSVSGRTDSAGDTAIQDNGEENRPTAPTTAGTAEGKEETGEDTKR